MLTPISFTNTKQQYQNLKPQIDEAIQTVLANGRLLNGTNTQRLEHVIKTYCNRKYAIAVNSGTTALQCISAYAKFLRHSKFTTPELVSREVVTTNLSYYVTKNVARDFYPTAHLDVDQNGLMDLNEILYNKVSCIFTVNLFGQVVNYEQILFNAKLFSPSKILVIEDAAQSLGSSLNGVPSGKLGWASALSFDPTKVLNCSSGGMVLTDDAELAEFAYSYRSTELVNHNTSHNNRKITEIDSAMLLVKFPHLERWQQRRTQIAKYYIERLKNVETLSTPENTISNWSRFPIVLKNTNVRDSLEYFMNVQQIESKKHYPYYIHTHSPGAERFVQRSLSLPIYAELTDTEVERIVEVVNKVNY